MHYSLFIRNFIGCAESVVMNKLKTMRKISGVPLLDERLLAFY